MDYQFDITELLIAISDVIDMADPDLMQHQQRTTYIAIMMAKEAKLKPYDIERLFLACILHDIGAFTVNEKVALHNFERIKAKNHCELGHNLYESIDWLKASSMIVLNHHKAWSRFETPIDDIDTFCTQILFLSNLVERKIQKDEFIPLQKNRIRSAIESIPSTIIHEKVVNLFLEVSQKDAFWFDLESNKVRDVLISMLTTKYIHLDIGGMQDLSHFLKRLIDFRSRNTSNHSSGVSICASYLSKQLNFSDNEVKLMEIAGNIHDIGKLGIKETVLEKPDKLDEEEFELIKSHVYYTYKLLHNVKSFEKISEWASYHHEKLDGNGYPFKLNDKQISLGSRIVAVSDVYTALTEDRSYRPALPIEKVISILEGMVTSRHLDGHVVKVLLAHENEIHRLIMHEKKSSTAEYLKTTV